MRRHVTFYAILVSLIILGGVALSLPASPVFAASPGGGPRGDNDASSGGDAGNTPFDALPLAAGRRMWSANLTPPGTDADWYRLDATGASCAVADATTSAPGLVTLASSPSRDATATRDADPHKPMRLALAGPAGAPALFGIEPPRMMLMAAADSPHPSPGRYTFSMETRGYAELDPQDDGEVPEAGATPATAAPLAPDCTAGRLAASDLADTFSVDVSAPRYLTISFAIARGDGAHARIVSPTGATVATLANGGATDVMAEQAGRWSVVVERTNGARLGPAGFAMLPILASGGSNAGTTDYILGMTDGPDPQPCRPSCR